MPLRTRQDMHIGIELGVNLLNSNKYYKLEPEVKDYFINKAIDAFVDETIYKNTPEIHPQLGLSYEQILKKYNRIYTLIKQVPLALNTKTTTPPIPNYREADLPLDIYHFEGSISKINSQVNSGQVIEVVNNLPQLTDIYSTNTHPYSVNSLIPNTSIINNKLRIFDFNKFVINSADIIYIKQPNIVSPNRVQIPYPITISNTTLQAGGNIDLGSHVYYLTYVLNGVEIAKKLSNPRTTTGGNQTIHFEFGGSFPVGTTTAKIYRTLTNDDSGIPYFVGYGNIASWYYGDNVPDSVIVNNEIFPFTIDGNCNLPIAYHDEIIDRAVSFITAIINLPNYQQILNELNKTK